MRYQDSSSEIVEEKIENYCKQAVILLTKALDIATTKENIIDLLFAINHVGKNVEAPISVIAKYLDSTDEKVRTSAIIALGGIGTARCAELLIPIVESGPWLTSESNYWVQRDGFIALLALRRIGENANTIIPRLLKLLQSDLDHGTKQGICTTLSKIGDTNGEIIEHIARYIINYEEEIDASVIQALYVLLFEGGAPFEGLDSLLKKLCNHENIQVVYWAELALEKMEQIWKQQN